MLARHARDRPLGEAAERASLQALGGLSGEIQESMSNFRVIVAFNRADYFRSSSAPRTRRNYAASVSAGVANNVFVPLYGLALNLAQLIVLAYGFYLIAAGSLTVGLLIGFLLYVNSFYMPLRQLAAVWSSFQLAIAASTAFGRAGARAEHAADAAPGPRVPGRCSRSTMCSSATSTAQEILRTRRFALERGKTYALVGPDRRRQDDDGVADGAAVRSDGRARAARRPRHPLVFAGGARASRSASSCRSRFSSPAPCATTSCTATKRYGAFRTRDSRGVWRRSTSTACSSASSRGSTTKVTAGGDGVSLGQKQLDRVHARRAARARRC